MYDDWGNEIAISPMVNLQTDEAFVPGALPTMPMGGDGVIWDEDVRAYDAGAPFSLAFSEDGFVSESVEADMPLMIKPEEDWLTPLNNVSTVDDVIVTGPRQPFTWTRGDDDRPYDRWVGHDTGPPPEEYQPNFSPADCATTDMIGIIQAPDGATYYVPEGVTADYLLNAIRHLQSISDPVAKLGAFNNMYTDRFHPHFIDFKDWGNPNSGPPGSKGANSVDYYSESLGRYVTTSPFEAFGNYFYGFAGVFGGIAPEVLGYAAGVLQTGNDVYERLMGKDDAQDRPHVKMGIEDGKYSALLFSLKISSTVFSVNDSVCD